MENSKTGTRDNPEFITPRFRLRACSLVPWIKRRCIATNAGRIHAAHGISHGDGHAGASVGHVRDLQCAFQMFQTRRTHMTISTAFQFIQRYAGEWDENSCAERWPGAYITVAAPRAKTGSLQSQQLGRASTRRAARLPWTRELHSRDLRAGRLQTVILKNVRPLEKKH